MGERKEEWDGKGGERGGGKGEVERGRRKKKNKGEVQKEKRSIEEGVQVKESEKEENIFPFLSFSVPKIKLSHNTRK